MKAIICCLTLGLVLVQVSGHGFMYYPWNWSDKNQIDPESGMQGSQWGNDYVIPDDHCTSSSGVPCHSAMYTGRSTDWFTNYTWISMSSSLPWWKRTPWQSPGSAPIHGQGCGANGGNPYPMGCQYPGPDTDPYGTKCKWNGGYVGGRPAVPDQAAEGLFSQAPVTSWQRGKAHFVYWSSGARHRGGYAYRLCKVPSGGISKVTESCFQNGHLNFANMDSWIYDRPWSWFNTNKWQKITAQSKTGPGGKIWRVINLPKNSHWAFRDQVWIPSNLPTGDYVLSFRWDCQLTPQIWSSCANIKIV